MGIFYHFIGKMASVSPDKLTKDQKDELCVSYAALMLHDDGLEINAEKLSKIVKASGNEIEPYWPALFAKALKGQDVGALLSNIGSAGGGGGGGATPAGPAATEEKEKSAEKEKEKTEEIETVEMGNLFGDD